MAIRLLETLLKLQLLLIAGTLLFRGVSYSLECYACDSAEDPECATRPGQQLEVEECSGVSDLCVTSITAGLTRRGCLGRLYPNGYCAAPCDSCNTSLCNRHVFPTDRLRCYQCSGSTCIDVANRPELLLPCPVYNEDDRCYTNILHLSNTMRGCEHTNLPDTCPHVCLKCNYNGCNSELTVTESRCLQCTHMRLSPNPDCLREQELINDDHDETVQCALSNETVTQCVNKVMLGHREQCYTHLNTQTEVLQRGCSTTMGFFPTGELTQCYGDYCNAQCQDIACGTCNSTSNPNCRSGISLSTEKCAAGTVACYACEQANHSISNLYLYISSDTFLRRGCADADFIPATDQGETCQLCRSSDNCNRYSVRSCYRCNSQEQDDDDCAEMNLPSAMTISNCTDPMELCVSTVINRLNLIYTVRGCASQVPECSANDPYCVKCNGSLCNNVPTQWAIEKIEQINIPLLDSPKQQKQRWAALTLLKYLWPDP
ncbi:uncharacterized protein [Drosophila tropicalis]|uniref:uncharacterized protein isoform X3 n=1 Tax=Drosophila tropicalis TaxID=46794 RepID=UPI0035ABF32D